MSHRDYAGCAIPPLVHDIGFGWDPRPEIERLLFVARQAGVEPGSALELGCGTGRLLQALLSFVPDVVALDLSPTAVTYAQQRCDAEVRVGDMSDFALDRRFDLIFASANAIRHVCADDDIHRMWNGIADHLEPGGVFVADLELGFDAEAEKIGKPACWMISRGIATVHVSWETIEPPSADTRCCTIRWTFESRDGEPRGKWSEAFPLRTYDAEEFVRRATSRGRLRLSGVYEPRDPYLLETPVAKAVGRMLVALQLED